MKTTFKTLFALLLFHQSIFGASNTVSKDVLLPNSTAYDITFTDDTANKIYINKTYIEVDQVVKEIEKIANALVPRDITVANCSSSTGCPLSSVQCDAVTETPFCPDGSTLNTTRDMCQKDPDVFSCPTGFTYDVSLKQCVKPLDCPSGGTYSIERNRCEFKRIYECPTGYTQNGDTCIAPPTCPSGATFDPTSLKCITEPTFACADAGWTYDPSTNKCFYAPPTCPTGYSYNKQYDVCLLNYTVSCPSGYTLNSTRNRCEKTPPDCPSGTTYNATTNRCEQGANSACAIAGGTWNGSSCTVNESYVANKTISCPPKVNYRPIDMPNEYDTDPSSWSWYQNSLLSLTSETSTQCVYEGTYVPHPNVWLKAVYSKTSPTGCPALYQNSAYAWTFNLFNVSPNTAASLYDQQYGNKSGSVCLYAVRSVNDFYFMTPMNFVYSCPNGGTLSGTTCNATSNVAPSCPSGYTHDGSGKCYANPTCPSSGSFDGTNDVCYVVYSKTCSNGATYDVTTDSCLASYTPTCATGYTYNSTRSRCEKTPPDCPSGTTYNATTNRCEQGSGSACTLSGGTWNGTNCTVGSNYAATVTQTVTQCYYGAWGNNGASFMYDEYVLVGQNSTKTGEYCRNDGALVNGGSVLLPGASTSGGGGIIIRNLTTPTTTYTCPSGGTLSGTTCINQTTVAPSCPSGYTHDGLGKCYANPTCPSSGSFDGTNDVCYLPYTKGCTSGTLLPGLDICVENATCTKGSLNKTLDRCEQDYQPVCGTGWTFNSTTQMCEKDPVCIVGTYSKQYDKCLLAYTPTCATGYTYNSTRSRCEKTPPDCPSGTTYNATTNRCEQGSGSACTLSGGTWNGTNCTVGSNYAATGVYTREPASGEYYNNNIIYTKWYWSYIVNTNKIQIYWNNTALSAFSASSTTTSFTSADGYTYYRGAYKESVTINSITTNLYGIYRIKNTPDSYTCPNGGTLSGTTCINQTTVAPSCPSGYTHDGLGKCYANPTCPSSGSFDGNLDVCWLAFGKSCTMGTYDATSNSCINEPICDGGTLNSTLDKCQLSREIVCAQGVKDLTTGKCTFSATCQAGATLDAKGCNEEPIPLTCPSGTDTTLDVCYSDVNACKVDSTYPKISTFTYSDALNICIVDENVICASSLTWSANYLKCEAVPICYNGMYNPENDFCYISTKACPINAAYPCKGPIGNQWCSPYECNPTTNQCGYAECPGGIQPSLTAEMNPKYNANLVYNATDTLCTDAYCNLANSSRFTYCGLEAACPSGFGVFEQNSKCFVRECPKDSFQENNKCYSLGCPKGTTEQGSGKCLVN